MDPTECPNEVSRTMLGNIMPPPRSIVNPDLLEGNKIVPERLQCLRLYVSGDFVGRLDTDDHLDWEPMNT